MKLRALLLVLVLPFPVHSGTLAAQEPIQISVAISLLPATRDAVELYRERNPSSEFRLNSGGSGVLLQQALRGAPGDLLISASTEQIDRLVARSGALEQTRQRIASNRLVVVTPGGGSSPALDALEDLRRPEFDRIAVGNARSAPLGRYTHEALLALGLWEDIRDRLVPAENSRQVLEYVARGDVSAGIVYETDARLLAGRVLRGPQIPTSMHSPVVYEGIVLAASAQRTAAREFLEWLSTEEGRAALARHGFRSP